MCGSSICSHWPHGVVSTPSQVCTGVEDVLASECKVTAVTNGAFREVSRIRTRVGSRASAYVSVSHSVPSPAVSGDHENSFTPHPSPCRESGCPVAWKGEYHPNEFRTSPSPAWVKKSPTEISRSLFV
eukprot:4273345-Prymnesium_polylepis.1